MRLQRDFWRPVAMLTQAATIIHPARRCISIWRRDSNSGVAITRRLGLNACALGEPSRLQCLVHGWLFIGNQTHPSHVQVGQGPGSLNAAACPPARHADHPARAHRWLGRPDRATGPGSGPAAAPFCGHRSGPGHHPRGGTAHRRGHCCRSGRRGGCLSHRRTPGPWIGVCPGNKQSAKSASAVRRAKAIPG